MKSIYKDGINIQYGLIDMEKINGPLLFHMIENKDEDNEYDEILVCDIYSLVLVLYMKGYSNYDCNSRNILLPPNSYPMMIDTAEVETRMEAFNETIPFQTPPDELAFITKFLKTNEIIRLDELSPVRIALMIEFIEYSSPFYRWMRPLNPYKRSPFLIERLQARYNNEPYSHR
jgi:hypothetical protein